MEFTYKHPDETDRDGETSVRFEAADFKKRKAFEANLPNYLGVLCLLESDNDSYTFEGIHPRRIFYRVIRGEPLQKTETAEVAKPSIYPQGSETVDGSKYL